MNHHYLKDLINQYQAEQRPDEVIWFYDAVLKIKPQVIVEIGIKEGGNTKILSTHLDKNGVIIGIDPRKNIPWKMDDTLCEVYHITKDSHLPDTVQDLKTILNGKQIDVLFIDGDHSTKGMLADFYDYSPLVKVGGLIAVHDIYYLTEVAEAWKQIPLKIGKRFESPKFPGNIGIGYVVKE